MVIRSGSEYQPELGVDDNNQVTLSLNRKGVGLETGAEPTRTGSATSPDEHNMQPQAGFGTETYSIKIVAGIIEMRTTGRTTE